MFPLRLPIPNSNYFLTCCILCYRNFLKNKFQDQTIEIDRFKTMKDNLQVEVADLKSVIGDRDVNIVTLKESLATSNKATVKVEQTVKEQKQVIDKIQKEIDISHAKYTKLQDEFDIVNFNSEKTKKQFNKIVLEFKMKEEEIAKLKTDYERSSKGRDMSDKRIRLLEEQKEVIRGEYEKVKQLISQMEREVDDGKKKSDEYKRMVEKLTRDKEIMSKNMLRQQGVQRDQLKLIKIQQQAKRKLESEIYNYIMERGNTAKQIKYLEKERDRIVEEHLELTKKIEDYMDEFKLKKVINQNNNSEHYHHVFCDSFWF